MYKIIENNKKKKRYHIKIMISDLLYNKHIIYF